LEIFFKGAARHPGGVPADEPVTMGHIDQGENLQEIGTKGSKPEIGVRLPVKDGSGSPLGWSIKGRLICAALAAALLWLAVAWAIGWDA
jgi:hypothetical protein